MSVESGPCHNSDHKIYLSVTPFAICFMLINRSYLIPLESKAAIANLKGTKKRGVANVVASPANTDFINIVHLILLK
jgi:hypothetical protein